MSALPSMPRRKPRVLFYSHDGLGLGHIRRTLAVAEALICRVPKASRLLLTGQPLANGFELPRTLDFVRMPGLDKRTLFEGDAEHDPGAPNDVFDLRKAIIAATFDVFAPHMVVVDHTAAGLAGELRPILERPLDRGSRPIFVLGLRDIVYGAERTKQEWTRTGSYDLMEQVYDRILIYGSPRVFDPTREYQFSPAMAAKTTFTGYLRRPEPLRPTHYVRRELGAEDQPLVAVSAGGGADGATMIATFLDAIQGGLLPGIVASVVTGPQMPAAEAKRLQEIAALLPNVVLARFRNDMESLVAAADVVVTMAGYNSAWEAVSAGKRPILIPREGGSNEQPLRAARMAALGLATALPHEQLTPQRLATAILDELDRGVSPAVTVEFDGIERTGAALADALGG